MCQISKTFLSLLVCGVLLPRILAAAPSSPATKPAAATHPANKTNGEAEILAEDLRSPDPAVVEEAMARIIQLTRKDPWGKRLDYSQLWLKALVEAKQEDKAIELAGDGVVAAATHTMACVVVQESRVSLLLSLGKNQEALINAKSLYNVGEMNDTARALGLIAECLEKAHPDDPGILRRFRDEQLIGATTQPSTETAGTGPAAGPSIMAGIQVDPAPYERAAKETGNDYKGLVTRGNLLLLADQPKAAREAFERAYDIAEERDLTSVTESLARCIKAEDGTIGRANAFVLSLRPKLEFGAVSGTAKPAAGVAPSASHPSVSAHPSLPAQP